MEQLAIGFLLGVLTAGIGAVFQHQITTGAHDRATRRALTSEIRENMRRLGGPVVHHVPSAAIVRVAWDAARALPLDDDVFDAIAEAYMQGAGLERWVAILTGRATNTSTVVPGSPEDRAREDAIAKATRRGQAAYDAFASALKLLENSRR